MQKLGKYVLTRELGAGGMGVVYEGFDPTLNRAVAIKIMPPERGPNADIRRFKREAEAAAAVHHPNCVTIYEIEEDAGRPYLVMELVRGLNAGQLVEQTGPLAWLRATRILIDACKGLGAIHAAGLIHRDVKPSNVLVADSGAVKLADFGLARVAGKNTPSLTDERTVGTPHFMSPEQCWNEPLDARTDIYALGATYFALLVGHPPYRADRDLQVMFAHCNNPTPDPRKLRPDLPVGCMDVIFKSMAKAPAERYQTANEMRAALEAVLMAHSPTDSLASGGTLVGVTADGLSLPGATTAALIAKRGISRRRALLAIPPAIAAIGTGIFFSTRGSGRPGAGELDRGSASSGVTSETGRVSADPAIPIADGTAWELGGSIRSVSISDDLRWVAVGMAGKEGERGVKLFDRTGPGHEPMLWGWKEHLCPDVALSPDGSLLAAAGHVRVILWSTTARRELEWQPTRPYSPVGAVAFSPDGSLLAAALNSWGTEKDQPLIRLWHVAGTTGTHFRDLNARSAPIRRLSFSPDGKTLAASVGSGGGVATTRPTNQIMVWNLGDASFTALPSPGVTIGPKGIEIRPNAVFARAEWVLAVARRDAISTYLSPALNRQRQPWVPGGAEPYSIALSPDGKLLAAALDDAVRIYDTVNGRVRTKLAPHKGPVLTMAFTANGHHLVTAGYFDGTIRFRSVPG